MSTRALITRSLLPVLALVAGCAGMTERECAADWFETGQNEGRIGASGMDQRHASHCPNFDAARYREGYLDGISKRRPPPV